MTTSPSTSAPLAVTDNSPWLSAKLFSMRQQAVADWLNENGIETFIPVQMVHFVDREGKRRKELRPVVRNIIFFKKTAEQKALAAFLRSCPYPIHVYRRSREDHTFCEISASEMLEFRIMCNPDIEMRKFISSEEAKLKEGAKVIVTHGPLKGLTGRLVRSSKKYYLLKEVPGIGVMLKVSRWCCEPAEN